MVTFIVIIFKFDKYDDWSYNLIMDKRLIKKQEIIRKSIGIMFEKGYHGTGVKDLADAAGIPKGSIYNYFENKEDYLKEALIYYYEVMSKEQFEILEDKSLKAVDRISSFYGFMIKNFNESNFSMGCFIGKVTQEVSGTSELIRETTSILHNDIINKLVKNLKEAKVDNDIKSSMDEFILAEFIFDSWQGTLLRLKASRNKQTLDNFYRVLNEVLLK